MAKVLWGFKDCTLLVIVFSNINAFPLAWHPHTLNEFVNKRDGYLSHSFPLNFDFSIGTNHVHLACRQMARDILQNWLGLNL